MTALSALQPIDEHAACIQQRQRSETLESEILKLAGEINAADYRFLKLLASSMKTMVGGAMGSNRSPIG